MDLSGVNFGVRCDGRTFASRGQTQRQWSGRKPLERLLLRTPLVPWSYVASNVYYNLFWYPLIGRRRVKQALATEWGKLFRRY